MKLYSSLKNSFFAKVVSKKNSFTKVREKKANSGRKKTTSS
jgi:hypothetical protein